MTLSRPQAAALLADNGLAPQRSLGQNFVVDPNTVRKIARIADVRSGDIVLEIGAGLGSLTAALAETGAQVIAVEVDRGIVPVLREQMANIPNVEVVEADAMTLNWHEFLADINTRTTEVPMQHFILWQTCRTTLQHHSLPTCLMACQQFTPCSSWCSLKLAKGFVQRQAPRPTARSV